MRTLVELLRQLSAHFFFLLAVPSVRGGAGDAKTNRNVRCETRPYLQCAGQYSKPTSNYALHDQLETLRPHASLAEREQDYRKESRVMDQDSVGRDEAPGHE